LGSPRLYKGAGYLPFKFYTASSPPDNEISWYGKFKSSSGPTQNPGAVHLKIDVQLAYDIQLGCSWTLWKYKEIMFQMGLVPYPTKIRVDQNGQNKLSFQKLSRCCDTVFRSLGHVSCLSPIGVCPALFPWP
jgi:hypothetical protein